MTAPREERPLGELLGDLTNQVSTLVRQEVELARTEMTANVIRVARNSALIGLGGAVLYAAFLALVITAIAVLATLGLDVWVAALIVAVVLAVVGALLVMRGRSALSAGSLAPNRTIETLKEDAEWAKAKTR